MRIVLLGLFILILQPGSSVLAIHISDEENADWKVIYAGQLMSVPGKAFKADQTIIIKDDLIFEVLDGLVSQQELVKKYSVTTFSEVIDLSNSYVLPGMIDSHTHLVTSKGSNSLTGTISWSDARWALSALPNLRATLGAGYTTVRDIGSFNRSIYDLRNAVEEGIIDGPRIIAVAEMLTPSGGHGDRRPLRPEYASPKLTSICDGPAECRKAVRNIILNHADFVKIKVSGGVLTGTPFGRNSYFYDDEIIEIVKTTHDQNRKVAVHATDTVSMLRALKAGVDSIEHGSYMTKETVSLFKKHKTYLVPTLTAAMEMGKYGDPNGTEEDKYLANLPKRYLDSIKLAYESGVLIAFGTDAGVFPHGQNSREFEYLEEIGVKPMDAIVMATINAADLLGMKDKIGKILPGMFADIIALEANPLENIKSLKNVHFVMKGGKIFKQGN